MLGEEEESPCLFPSLRFELRLETTFPLSIPDALSPPPLAGLGSSSSASKVCCGLNDSYFVPGVRREFVST